MEQMIASVDVSSNGGLDMSEFIKLMSRHHNPMTTAQYVIYIFDIYI